MPRAIRVGDCVRLPDGRTGRVRGKSGIQYRVRVRRKIGKTHQFIMLTAGQIHRVDCPKGWMSPPGYMRYLRITLAKMRARGRGARLRRLRQRGTG